MPKGEIEMKKVFLFLVCIMFLLGGCGVMSNNGEISSYPTNEVLAMETTTIENQEYYLVKTESELKSIGETYSLAGNYVLDNDITLTEEWEPIGNDEYPFIGVFDGNGYTIYNLTVTKKSDNMGFFGATEGATLKNIVLEDAQIDILSFFPISYNAIDTEIVDCSVNANKQSSSDDAGLQTALGYDEEETLVDKLLYSDYQNMTVAEFDTLVLDTFKDTDTLLAVIEDLTDYYDSDSEEYTFIKYTLPASYSEIISNSSTGSFEGILIKERTAGRVLMDTIEFSCHVTYKCSYEIVNNTVTVLQRDHILQEFDTQMQDYLECQSEEFLEAENAKQELSQKIEEISEKLSSDDICFTAQLNQLMLLDANGEYRVIK